MKRTITFVFLLIVGCGPGDSALPIVSSTQIPGTRLSVHLGGPDTNGRFGYYITSSSGTHYQYRPLGRLRRNQTTPAVLESLGGGIFRIQWGDPSTAVFAIIDTKSERFVEDSNRANPKDQPFVKQ
jgi:hypothetical protein